MKQFLQMCYVGILTALDLCNFQQYCIVLNWVMESSRRSDVTAKAAAEWRTGAGATCRGRFRRVSVPVKYMIDWMVIGDIVLK